MSALASRLSRVPVALLRCCVWPDTTLSVRSRERAAGSPVNAEVSPLATPTFLEDVVPWASYKQKLIHPQDKMCRFKVDI